MLELAGLFKLELFLEYIASFKLPLLNTPEEFLSPFILLGVYVLFNLLFLLLKLS